MSYPDFSKTMLLENIEDFVMYVIDSQKNINALQQADHRKTGISSK